MIIVNEWRTIFIKYSEVAPSQLEVSVSLKSILFNSERSIFLVFIYHFTVDETAVYPDEWQTQLKGVGNVRLMVIERFFYPSFVVTGPPKGS